MGSLEGSNHRNINKMLVNQVLPTCQLQMGMTELCSGQCVEYNAGTSTAAVWKLISTLRFRKTMLSATFMGEVDETRHVWMKGDQAVLSPEWSIHSACSYAQLYLIWGMGGENLDYGDQGFLD